MTATELFQAGKLADATAAQIAKVKANPTDNRARLFLFELFLFAGDLDRAKKQLEAVQYDKPEQLATVAGFREALDAEAKRRAVFAGTVDPNSLSTPPEHVRLRLAAVKALAAGNGAEGRELLDQAAAVTPVVMAAVNDGPPAPLADADGLFGPVLEVFGSGGAYAWVPLETVESLTFHAPATPRHIAWRPAHLVTRDGMDGEVQVLGLYPNTHLSADEELKTGRATDWTDDPNVSRAVGGRAFESGGITVPLVQLKSIAIPLSPAAGA
jgi:type VI secretion system protein ImpE